MGEFSPFRQDNYGIDKRKRIDLYGLEQIYMVYNIFIWGVKNAQIRLNLIER